MTRVVWDEKVKNNVPKDMKYDKEHTTLSTHSHHHPHIHTTLSTHIPHHAHMTDILNHIDAQHKVNKKS